MSRILVSLSLAVWLMTGLFLFSGRSAAQTTSGVMSGSVVDASGRAIVGADVEITN